VIVEAAAHADEGTLRKKVAPNKGSRFVLPFDEGSAPNAFNEPRLSSERAELATNDRPYMGNRGQSILAELGIGIIVEVNGAVTQPCELPEFFGHVGKQDIPSHKGINRQFPIIK